MPARHWSTALGQIVLGKPSVQQTIALPTPKERHPTLGLRRLRVGSMACSRRLPRPRVRRLSARSVRLARWGTGQLRWSICSSDCLGCEDEIVSGVWIDFGLTIGPVREMVRYRLGGDPGAGLERRVPFSQAAKNALRFMYRFALGEPGPEHLLIVLTRRGEGGASEAWRRSARIPTRSGLTRRSTPTRTGSQEQL